MLILLILLQILLDIIIVVILIQMIMNNHSWESLGVLEYSVKPSFGYLYGSQAWFNKSFKKHWCRIDTNLFRVVRVVGVKPGFQFIWNFLWDMWICIFHYNYKLTLYQNCPESVVLESSAKPSTDLVNGGRFQNHWLPTMGCWPYSLDWDDELKTTMNIII